MGASVCTPVAAASDPDRLPGRLPAALIGPAGMSDGEQAPPATARLYASPIIAAWSESPAWRRLNRWSRSLLAAGAWRSENLDDDGFAAPIGRRSPRWDLAAFAAAALLDDAVGDARIACRLPSQAAFLRGRLATIGIAMAAPACSAFERWAALDRLAGVELVLAAPSTAMAGSLFGHLFLRLVYRDPAGDTPPHLSRALAFLADNDRPFDDDPGYAWKGIVGLYAAMLHERPFLETYREYGVLEGRDLRRWRVELDPAERRALLERLWSTLHGARYSYTFFRRNCANLMLDLVDDARPSEDAVRRPGLLAAPPASALEAWANARARSGAPLLTFVPAPILSFEHEARIASAARRAREADLALAMGPAAAAARAAFDRARAADPATRADGYDQLAALLSAGAARGPAPAPGWSGWMRDSAVVESHLSAVANHEEEARVYRTRRLRMREVDETLARALAADPALAPAAALARSPDEARRLTGYTALRAALAGQAGGAAADRVRLYVLFRSELEYDVARMKGVPGLRDALLFPDPRRSLDEQAYLAGYESLLRFPVETRVAPPLLALQRAAQAARRARGEGPETAAPDDPGAQAAAIARVQEERYAASQPRSGIDQLAVAGGLAPPGAGRRGDPFSAGLVLAGALYDEQLGDHRRFGFSGDTALVVARSRTFLTTAGRGVAVSRYDARVLGWRTLRAPLPEATGRARPLGWELYLDIAGDRSRALAAAVKAGWGLLIPLLDDGELSDHVLGGAAVAWESDFPRSAVPGAARAHALGAPLALEGRLGVGARPGYRSWVAGRASAEPMLVISPRGERFGCAAGVSAEAHLALRRATARAAHDPALWIRAELARTTLTPSDGVATTALATLGIELR